VTKAVFTHFTGFKAAFRKWGVMDGESGKTTVKDRAKGSETERVK